MIKAKVIPDFTYNRRYYFSHFFRFEIVLYNLVLSLIFSGLLLWVTYDDRVFREYGWRMILVGTIFYTIFVPLFLFAYTLIRSASAKSREVDYSFTEDGLMVGAKGIENRMEWSYVKSIKEDYTYFRLTVKSGNFFLIPKLSFARLEDLVELKKLFKEKLGKEAHLISDQS